MSRFLLLLLVGVISLSVSLGQNANPNPRCNPNNLNKCTHRLLGLASGNTPPPQTILEVQVHCGEIRNASQCLRGYLRDCTSDSTKQMARVVASGVTKRINKNCSPLGMQEILRHADCMKASRGALKQCYKQGIKDIYTLRMSEDRTKWHALMCCFGSRGYDCATTAVKQNCDPENIEYFRKESTQLVGEMMDTFCPSNLEWGKPECADLVANLPGVTLPTDRNITILPMILDIVKEFSIETDDGI